MHCSETVNKTTADPRKDKENLLRNSIMCNDFIKYSVLVNTECKYMYSIRSVCQWPCRSVAKNAVRLKSMWSSIPWNVAPPVNMCRCVAPVGGCWFNAAATQQVQQRRSACGVSLTTAQPELDSRSADHVVTQDALWSNYRVRLIYHRTRRHRGRHTSSPRYWFSWFHSARPYWTLLDWRKLIKAGDASAAPFWTIKQGVSTS